MLSRKEIRALVRLLHNEWLGNTYNLNSKNCVDFSRQFCYLLCTDTQFPEALCKLVRYVPNFGNLSVASRSSNSQSNSLAHPRNSVTSIDMDGHLNTDRGSDRYSDDESARADRDSQPGSKDSERVSPHSRHGSKDSQESIGFANRRDADSGGQTGAGIEERQADEPIPVAPHLGRHAVPNNVLEFVGEINKRKGAGSKGSL